MTATATATATAATGTICDFCDQPGDAIVIVGSFATACEDCSRCATCRESVDTLMAGGRCEDCHYGI